MLNFQELLADIQNYPVRKAAVAVAQDPTVLKAVEKAYREKVATCVLVGDRDECLRIGDKEKIDLKNHILIDCPDDIQAAQTAVKLVANGEADIVMKGHIHTDDFLRAVLNREKGLRTGVLMSHVFVTELPGRDRFLVITDGAMNIAPDLEKKAEILLNAIHLAHALGFKKPRVAALAAIELLNPAMPATVDATCLHKMSERGQFSPNCIVDGPFGLDNAISEIAAKHKRIEGPVAGKADILLVPEIEAGNILAKSLVYFAGALVAGVVIGASHPVVLTSRADSADSKYFSIALAVYLVNIERHLKLKIGKVHY